MKGKSHAEGLILGLPIEFWTVLNSIASIVTAAAAIAGIYLAWRAVKLSREGVLSARESTVIARRTYVDDAFLSMMTAVRSYGAALYLWVEEARRPTGSSKQHGQHDLDRIYVQLQSVEQQISQFRLSGLPSWDHHLRGHQGLVTLDSAMAAMEFMVSDRFDQALLLAQTDDRDVAPLAAPVESALEAYVVGFMSRLTTPEQRGDESIRRALRDAFRFHQDQLWADQLMSGTDVSRLELSRQAFDHVLNLVSDCYSSFVFEVAPWANDLPPVPRAWT